MLCRIVLRIVSGECAPSEPASEWEVLVRRDMGGVCVSLLSSLVLPLVNVILIACSPGLVCVPAFE